MGTTEDVIVPGIQNMFQKFQENKSNCYASVVSWVAGVSLLEDGCQNSLLIVSYCTCIYLRV